MPKFSVTYSIVTLESDVEEYGYVCRDVGLREAVAAVGRVAYEDFAYADSETWFANPEYRQGTGESRHLHPPRDITGASYNRLRRLFGV